MTLHITLHMLRNRTITIMRNQRNFSLKSLIVYLDYTLTTQLPVSVMPYLGEKWFTSYFIIYEDKSINYSYAYIVLQIVYVTRI